MSGAPHLVKSHGLGNDYLVADPTELPLPMTPPVVRVLCDRHVGVGSDGLLLSSDPNGPADFGLRIINPDGSEAEKSGNGIRIFAKWLYETGRATDTQFRIATLGGIVPVELELADGRVRQVTADMGVPRFRDELRSLDVDGEMLGTVALSIGNPHCVVFRDPLERDDLLRLGPRIERHAAFPDRTNVQLARVTARDRVEALIWERGAGETQASGSSSCAVAAAAYHEGLVDQSLTVAMAGGNLDLRIDNRGSVWMRGPVEEVAHITLSQELIERLRAVG